MADAEYPVYRSDANEPEEPTPWEKHKNILRRQHEQAPAKPAAKKPVPQAKPDDSHQRLEQELNRAGKRHIDNARSVPPGMLGTMDNPGMVLDE